MRASFRALALAFCLGPSGAVRAAPSATCAPCPACDEPPEKSDAEHRAIEQEGVCAEDDAVRPVRENVFEISSECWVTLHGAGSPLRYARIVPHMENSQPVGCKLYGVWRQRLAGRLGFKNQDLIRAVNGSPVTDWFSLEANARSLSATTAVRIDVTRNGQAMTLEYYERQRGSGRVAACLPCPVCDDPNAFAAAQQERARQAEGVCAGDAAIKPMRGDSLAVAPDCWDFLHAELALLRNGTWLPFVEKGQPAGARVVGVRRDSVAGRLGFQNGDVVRSLGGRRVTDLESLAAAAKAQATALIVRVELLRHDVTLTLTLRRK